MRDDGHDGALTGSQLVPIVWQPAPQNSSVVPQKPYWEQQTLSGQPTPGVAAYFPH